MRPILVIFSILGPGLSLAFLPLDSTKQGNKARIAYDLTNERSNHGACSERVLRWSTWNGGLEANILVHAEDEQDMPAWSAFLVFDRDVDSFVSYDGDVDEISAKAYKVIPKAWNAEAKKGDKKQMSIRVNWPQNSAEPKLASMTINGVPYTCIEGGQSEVEAEEEIQVPVETEEVEAVKPIEAEEVQKPEEEEAVALPENTNSPRGVFVPWPKKVMGLYVLLADDDHEGFESDADWDPKLYEWQQKAANVLFFTFIHPITMDIPPAFQKLAKSRGTNQPGAVPKDTVILFAIGGYAYSSKIKPWPWLESKEAAEKMAEKVAQWPELYGCDGVDLDLEDGAGDTPKAGPNMIHFVRKLRQLQPKMIIAQPTYGFPQVKAEIAVINASWKDKKSTGLADSVGLMVYQDTYALNYVKNYAEASKQWSGFPIKTDVPKNAILLGAKGAAGGGTVKTLADATMTNDYLGIMVWYASVQNGLQYAESWDASHSDSSIQGYIEAGTRFRNAS